LGESSKGWHAALVQALESSVARRSGCAATFAMSTGIVAGKVCGQQHSPSAPPRARDQEPLERRLRCPRHVREQARREPSARRSSAPPTIAHSMEIRMLRKLILGCLFLSLGACQAAEQESDVDIGENASGLTVASVTDGNYVLHSVATGKCLDVSGGSMVNGAAVQEWTCNGTGAQLFHVASLGDGYVKITNVKSGKSLDITGGRLEPNTKLEQWTYGGDPHQQFKIVARFDR
jgi:Ricin-type beta-trefoil lectin domain-like